MGAVVEETRKCGRGHVMIRERDYVAERGFWKCRECIKLLNDPSVPRLKPGRKPGNFYPLPSDYVLAQRERSLDEPMRTACAYCGSVWEGTARETLAAFRAHDCHARAA